MAEKNWITKGEWVGGWSVCGSASTVGGSVEMRTKHVTTDKLTEVVIVLPADHPDAAPFQLIIDGFHSRGVKRISILDDEGDERSLFVAHTVPGQVGLETY